MIRTALLAWTVSLTAWAILLCFSPEARLKVGLMSDGTWFKIDYLEAIDADEKMQVIK